MSQATLTSSEEDLYQQYRSLSFLAVVALVFGMISIPSAAAASMNPFLLVFPFIGMLLGLTAVLKLKNRTDEFTGLGLAKTGLMLSTILLFGGSAYAAYIYATEVPDGFQRISFSQLEPDAKSPRPWSQEAETLAGEKVFVKGYVYPDDQLGEIKRFILVPDMGTCCFGGKPKISDMIQVTLEDPHRVKYSMMRRSLAGKFQLGVVSNIEKVDEVMYHLDASYVK